MKKMFHIKKIIVTCFYLALTLAVCTAGFLLPSVLNSYQDRQIFSKIEHTAMEPPELTAPACLTRCGCFPKNTILSTIHRQAANAHPKKSVKNRWN